MSLTFTTLWTNSADDKLTIFCLFFPENRIWFFLGKLSMHEMSNQFSGKNKKKYFSRLSAEDFIQSAKP